MTSLSSMHLKNFKCFRDAEIDISGLTILTGVNGMGKSSLIQALLLLRQSFGLQNRMNRRLKLNGELIELGTGSDVFFDLADDDFLTVGYEFGESGGLSFRSEYRYEYDRSSQTLKPASTKEAFNNRVDEYWDDSSNSWIEIDRQNDGQKRSFRPPPIYSTSAFQYLSAERLGPRKMLAASEEHSQANQIGSQGEYVLGLLSEGRVSSLKEDDPRLHSDSSSVSLKSQVEAWMHEISPGTRLEINKYSDIDAFTSRYSFERKGDVPSKPFRATNVGFGISYVLPVIVSLLSSRRDGITIIENPEAHLHPRGQTRLGLLAALTSRAGVQVIIETHSDHFLDGVRLAVKENLCEPDDIAIHFFTRFGPEAAVISPDVLEDGRLSEWPEGFFDQRDDNLARLLSPVKAS